MQYKNLLVASLMGLGFATNALAANVSINGTIPAVVPVQEETNENMKSASAPTQMEISLERIILSDAAKKYLATHVDQNRQPSNLKAKSALPTTTQVGMNGVPVLNQGRHGTCVTFAVTGAIDATIDDSKPNGSTDRYSQLCSLELGNTLEKQSPVDPSTKTHSYPSGWDGSWGTLVFDQISTYGLVTKAYQEKNGCAGVKRYPALGMNHGKDMSIADYQKNGEVIMPPLDYKIVLDNNVAFSDNIDMEQVLTQVKTALAAKHRVTFGTLLDVNAGGVNGAVGTYKVPNDTWVLTDTIAADAKAGTIQAGHEMIIIGYDDNAVVTDPDNKAHKGVLTLRNSWGSGAGDKGNFYMTYDHFKTLTMEVLEVSPKN